MLSSLSPGLYIVATPIGNLGDITHRAADTLASVDHIACEDKRLTSRLLHHLGIKKPLLSYHDHSSEQERARLLGIMASQSLALVSDAGTPLISDPGYKLVRDARAAGIAITTLPGPCAAIAALTLAGLPTDRFLFSGFLPPKSGARRTAISELANVQASIVLYESGPRLAASLSDLGDILGDRQACVARELTKIYEEALTGSLSELANRYADARPRGEIVIVIAPPAPPAPAEPADVDAALHAALVTMSAAKAASHVAKTLGADRTALYAQAIAIKGGVQKDII